MIVVPKKRQWLVAAAVLAVGLPLLVLGGFTLTAAGVMAIDAMRSGNTHMGAPLGAWWLAGFAAIGVSHWFLVRWCVRVGGWRALILGLGGCVLVVIAAFAVSWLDASLQPNDSMAGLGSGIFAFVLLFFVLLAVVMGAVAYRVGFKRAGATSGLERTDNAD